jgi:hypothetical protein
VATKAEYATPPAARLRPVADLRYRCTPPTASPLAPSLPALAVDDGPVDLREVGLSLLDGYAPRLGRYVRGPAVLAPLVSRTATGETALGATVQLLAY